MSVWPRLFSSARLLLRHWGWEVRGFYQRHLLSVSCVDRCVCRGRQGAGSDDPDCDWYLAGVGLGRKGNS